MNDQPTDAPRPDRSSAGDLPADEAAGETAKDPGINSVYSFLTYGLWFPERALRSTSAMVGGVLRESTELLVPQAFRNSRSYSIFVQQMLDFMSENVGGVAAEESENPSATQIENYVARKTVGNFVEMAGWATMHVSPLTVLAIVSDLAYGSKSYLQELCDELKKEGIIAEDSTIGSTAELLEAVSNASGVTAQAFDTPPISVDGLRETVNQTRDALKGIDPSRVVPMGEITRLWNEMHAAAASESVSLFDVSSAMSLFALNKVQTVGRGALSSVRVAGNLIDRHILDHYSDGLRDIRTKGIYASVAESSRPYVEAVWKNFSKERATITEDLLTGRLIGRAWTGMTGWFRRDTQEAADDIDPPEADDEGEDPLNSPGDSAGGSAANA